LPAANLVKLLQTNPFAAFISANILECNQGRIVKPSLQLRTSQHLALTPQLQQSIRLLQLSTIELQQEIDQIVQNNPLLERLDDPFDNSLRLLADGAINPATPAHEGSENSSDIHTPAPAEKEPSETAEAGTRDEADSVNTDWDFDDASRSGKSADDEDSRPQIEDHRETLRNHLLEQVRLSSYGRRMQALLTLLADALDENGYLRESLEDILTWLPPELNVKIEELAEALDLLQKFDPVGIGARNISECLAIQIRQLPRIPFVTRKTALAIVEHHLDMFAHRDFTKLKKALDCDDEDLREAHAVIKQCNPRPGGAFSSDLADTILPDVIVKRTKTGWHVELNQDVIPRLQLNSMYTSMLKNNRGASKLSSELQEARWLIKNMHHRFETILRVAEAIVERQKNSLCDTQDRLESVVQRLLLNVKRISFHMERSPCALLYFVKLLIH
jgi:RNA polymerase sigma-54 factor